MRSKKVRSANMRKIAHKSNYVWHHMTNEELREAYHDCRNNHPKLLGSLIKYLQENDKFEIIR